MLAVSLDIKGTVFMYYKSTREIFVLEVYSEHLLYWLRHKHTTCNYHIHVYRLVGLLLN